MCRSSVSWSCAGCAQRRAEDGNPPPNRREGRAMRGKAIRAASRRLTLVDGSIWQSLGMIFFNRSPARRRRGSAA